MLNRIEKDTRLPAFAVPFQRHVYTKCTTRHPVAHVLWHVYSALIDRGLERPFLK